MVTNDRLFNLDDTQPTPAPGTLLVAKPTVDDPFFGRSVVLVLDHDDEGSSGLTLNKRLAQPLADLLPDYDLSPDIAVWLGGPVGTDMLFYVHTLGPERIPGSLPLGGGLFVGGDLQAMLAHVTRDGARVAGSVKFFLGYSGWAAGQLSQEIGRKDWAVIEGLSARVMLGDDPDGAMWRSAVTCCGDRYKLWLNWPADLSWN